MGRARCNSVTRLPDAAQIDGGEEEDGAQFAEGEDSDEGERIHAADVGLAVGDVHGAEHERQRQVQR